MNDSNTRRAGARLRRYSALAIAALCLLCANVALAQTFPANAGTLGAIPDNNPVGRSVTFDVSGATSIGDIRLSTTMNHTWVGDLVVTLSPPGVAPLAPGSFTLFQRIGATTPTGAGDSSDLNGTYNFFDAAPGDMWGTAVATVGGTIPPGDYRTMAVGTGAPTSLSVPFGALSAAAINGTWTLYVQDLAGGDTGSITAASLTIAAKVPTDLVITKTNGVAGVNAGANTTYTIVATNNGANTAPNSNVTDTFPAACSSVNWTCVGASGGTCTASGSGNINDTVNLPLAASVTYTATCAISAAATGTLANTATVTTGVSTFDTVPGDNNASDSDPITPLATDADLSISKTNGVASSIPGMGTTYTITASNAGPAAAAGSTVTDTFPAACASVNWTCTGAGGGTCTAAGSGNINDTVNLPVSASVTYTAICAISAAATGTLSNTATVAVPAGITDPTPGNNSATDSDTLTPQANLGISKTDGVATAVPGTNTTYTIVASNAGPSAAPSSIVADAFPAACTSVNWTCVGAGGGTCTASGSGNINNNVSLPVSASVTYTAICAISAAATGTLANTATVTAAAGIIDPTPGNNSATDSDTLTPQANLAITKTDGVASAVPGTNTTYTIVASNAGPSAAPGSTVADTFPVTCTSVNWTCVGAGGGTCTAAGSGNISDSADLPDAASVTYTATCAISAAATGTLDNTATVAAAAGVTDPTPGNNIATDSDTLVASADLSIMLTDSPDPVTAGTNLSYTATLTNIGPSDAQDVVITLPLPAGTSFVSATPSAGGVCNAATPVICTYAGVTAAAGVRSAVIVVAVAPAQVAGLSATATASSPTADPAAGNNTATADTAVVVSSDLSITLGDAPDPVTAGTNLTYTAMVTNVGPSDATGVTTTMPLPAGTSFVSGSVSAGGSCAGNPVVCTATGSIAPTASRTATIVVAVAPSVLTSTVLTATATVAAGSTDPNAANNSATTTTTVITDADLLLGLSASTAEVVVNVPVTFTATSLNQGPSDAQNVVITVTLTPDFRYSSHTATGATCTIPQVGTTGAIVCTWAGATAPGVTRTLQVVAFSNSEGNTGVNASTSSNTPDPVANNNLGNLSVLVGFLVKEIPTLSGLALILLGLMLGMLGIVAVRRPA